LRYLFEEYAFDTDRRELHRGANVVSFAPQVFDLLDYLIRNRERVVSKDDLINSIWNGRSVSDAALTTRLNVARGAIGDTGEDQRLVKILPRKGFRFVGQVREAQGSAGAAVADNPEEPPRPSLTLPDKPSIAILPFTNLGMRSGTAQAHFLLGRYAEAASWAAMASQDNPDYQPGLRLAAVTGQSCEIRNTVAHEGRARSQTISGCWVGGARSAAVS
jgi:DNA-binding winged helix-turn-helix (wHTH) protein